MPAPRPSASGSKLVRRPVVHKKNNNNIIIIIDEETGEVESGDDECGVFDGVFWHPEVTSAS